MGRKRTVACEGSWQRSPQATCAPLLQPEPAPELELGLNLGLEPEPELLPTRAPDTAAPAGLAAEQQLLMDRAWSAPASAEPALAAASFIGLEKLMSKHHNQVDVMRGWAERKSWRSFDTAHFDWWTFPINEPSRHGLLYALPSREEAGLLLALPEFVRAFREGLVLQARAWVRVAWRDQLERRGSPPPAARGSGCAPINRAALRRAGTWRGAAGCRGVARRSGEQAPARRRRCRRG